MKYKSKKKVGSRAKQIIGLETHHFTKKSQEYVDNYEYIHKLKPEDKLWLQAFNDIYYANNIRIDAQLIPALVKDKTLNEAKLSKKEKEDNRTEAYFKLKKITSDMTNNRNSDVYGTALATTGIYDYNDHMEALPAKTSEFDFNKNNIETICQNLVKETIENMLNLDSWDDLSEKEFKYLQTELLQFHRKLSKALQIETKYKRDMEKLQNERNKKESSTSN